MIPLNLPVEIIEYLLTNIQGVSQDYYMEQVYPCESKPPITFISPQSIPKKSLHPQSLAVEKMFSNGSSNLLTTYSPEDILAIFEEVGQEDALFLLKAAQKCDDYRLMRRLGLSTLTNRDKGLHSLGIELINLSYLGIETDERISTLEAIINWLPVCGYQPLLNLLELVENIVRYDAEDYEWRFIEQVIEFCMFIKSPDLLQNLQVILMKIERIRKVVLYISDMEDAHYTEYLKIMKRNFLLIPLDPIVALYLSPQGYPIPIENILMLFDIATFIWWRKPNGLPRGTTSLEKFTKREIEEFVQQLRIKYKEKIFPQYQQDDYKLVYFDFLAKYLQVVKVCESSFENSIYLWEKGDFIKPLRTQAVYKDTGEVEQSFSPFIYEKSKNSMDWISIMPPVIRQQNISKIYEVRGTFFLNEISCVKIDTPKLGGERGGIDWRYSSGVQENMHYFELPIEIEKDLINCFNKMNLLFCTFDLAFDGKTYFLLDVNHNGQWIFSDEICDMKITRKIINYLGNRGNSL